MNESAIPRDLLQHAGFLRRLSRSLLADEHGARDVEQETWRSALEHPPRAGELRGWISTVAANVARRRLRTEVRRSAREEAAARPEALPSVDAIVGREEIVARVSQAVLELDEPYRTTVLERYYEGLPPREIARRRGVSVETVHTQHKRALARLRRDLGHDARDWRPALVLLVGKSTCGGVGAWVGALAALTAIVTLGAAGLWSALRPGEEPTVAAPLVVARAAPSAAEGPASHTPGPIARGQREALPASVSMAESVSGRVTEEDGTPVAGASVLVLAAQDPFGPGHPAQKISFALGARTLFGRAFTTDSGGRWQAEPPGSGEVLVALGYSTAHEPVSERARRWVTPPATVEFVVRRLPTGKLRVRVLEGGGAAVEAFTVVIRGVREDGPRTGQPATHTDGYFASAARAGVAEVELHVPDPAGRRLLVTLSGSSPVVEQEVRLLAGEVREVALSIPVRGRLRGTVVDRSGNPIPSALASSVARRACVVTSSSGRCVRSACSTGRSAPRMAASSWWGMGRG